MTTAASALTVELPVGPIPAAWATTSPFAGLDVCKAAGWEVNSDAPRPSFDEDRWDLTGVKGYSRSVSAHAKVLDFTGIVNPAFRLTAKEYVLALLVPRHEEVLALPAALREPIKPSTAYNYTVQLVLWLEFLSTQGLDRLDQVLQEHCDVYLDMRRQRQQPGSGTGPLQSGSLVSVLQPVVYLAHYGDLFTASSYRAGFRPWPGRTIREIAGWKPFAGNSEPAVAEEVFQPTVAASLYLVETLGPLVAEEFTKYQKVRQFRSTTPVAKVTPGVRQTLAAVLNHHVGMGSPLPESDGRVVAKRLATSWTEDDPLVRVNTDRLLSSTGGRARILLRSQVEELRPMLEAAVARVGTAGEYGRDATLVGRQDVPERMVPWTLPITALELRGLQFVMLAACRTLVAAVAGMRASELDELTADSPLQPTTVPGGTQRFRLASTLVKGQAMGGVPEEWVVLEPAWRAVQLAARLSRATGQDPVFPNSSQGFLHKRLREWVNGPAGQRLGLAPIPPGPVNGRMLRRALALTLAHRPGGLLAAKIHLKHVSVVTTEGYAHRPGGSQANLLAEVEKEEKDHHLKLTAEAFEDYRAGRLPAGPGARDLIKAFEHIDAALKDHDPGNASVIDNERRLEMMLRQQSKHLHLQAANYCWFRDPAKALCLKLAGTPDAKRPLAGMCDSARCPQATHHPCHLPVWQSQAANHKVFLANPRFPKGEKTRLMPELERAQRVVDEIITARAASGGE
ncbi:hypothetical protein AB0E96_01010 [Kitasatospora sp. NPDC036755]|uniref:hypothetical protein n=1 Tax=Kitasatospora sp. NPDC036755 TaxID=3154600 RepID=UPI0033FFD31D